MLVYLGRLSLQTTLAVVDLSASTCSFTYTFIQWSSLSTILIFPVEKRMWMKAGAHLVKLGVCRYCCSINTFCNLRRWYSAWSACAQIYCKFVNHFCLFPNDVFMLWVESWFVWMFILQAVFSTLQADLSVFFMVFISLCSPLKAGCQQKKCWKCTVLQQCMSCLSLDLHFCVWFVWHTEGNGSKWQIL